MNHDRNQLLILIAAVSIFAAGCAKKVAVAPPPAPSHTITQASSANPASAPARVSSPPAVMTPASRYPDAATRARIDELLARIEDAYFDYDRATLRPDAVKALEADSSELRDILQNYPDYKLTIEGHCDERGSAEYNMALGDRRAESAKDYLVQVGIPSAQLNIVSYGKERPVCSEHAEDCWQRNRRIHILAMANAPAH